MSTFRLSSVAAILLCIAGTVDLRAASFQGLDFVSAGGMSADGSVVAGTKYTGSGGEMVRWTQASGAIGLGHLGPFDYGSGGTGVSADGTILAGYTGIPDVNYPQLRDSLAVRWTQSQGMVALQPSAPFVMGVALGISANGSEIVGTDVDLGSFRWTQSTGMVSLGDVSGTPYQSAALAASADGSVIVGTSATGQAFVWTQASGIVRLGSLPTGGLTSAANAITPDGSVVVGMGIGTQGNEAFRWTQAGGMVGLGTLSGASGSAATGISGDGSIIVGQSFDAHSSNAFIWDTVNGMRNLRDLLANDYGLSASLQGWTLGRVVAITPDGRHILGVGTPGPQSVDQVWMATIPEPSTAVLAGLGGLALLAMYRKR